MFRKCIYLWKKMVYSWNIAKSSAYFDLAQEDYRRNDIPRAIVNLEKALNAGKKASILLSEKYFPEATEARKGLLQKASEVTEKNRDRLLILSQRRQREVDINHT